MISKQSITIAVHDGTFHTDDVFAVAILSLVFADKEIEVIRTRDEARISAADIVVDVGGVYDATLYLFDHHQKEGAGMREGGVPYASAGLVWNTFGTMLCGGNEDMVKNIDAFLIQGIDGPDNGYDAYEDTVDNNPRYYRYSVGDIVNTYRPVTGEQISFDDAFSDAVVFAKKVLERTLLHATEYFVGKQKLQDAYNARESDHYICTDTEHRAWYEFASEHPTLYYMLYPRTTSGWSAKSTVKEAGSFEPRKAFPESWRGLQKEDLEAVTGVSGSIFCHRTGYLVVADTKEHILQLVKIAVES